MVKVQWVQRKKDSFRCKGTAWKGRSKSVHRARVQDSHGAVQEVGKETWEGMAKKLLMLKNCKALPYLDHKKVWILKLKIRR